MVFLYIKALHIIFIVTWFAGLFYIVRLFVYFSETFEKPGNERLILQKQYLLMQRRLWYGITWPSAILTLGFGSYLAFQYPSIPDWLWVKIGFVSLLYTYHFLCHHIFIDQQKGKNIYTSTQMRIWNEVSTIFLVAIVFLVSLKSTLSMVYGLVGLLVFSGLIMAAIYIYKRFREKN
jgi:putative membrane protein